ncbi:hypothetical protein CB0940_05829 [Cercospora beticola]|uniref:Uncharacterized protein n=1 Tax=Cercospora beticola TaxID=122368 RepID=A0A2G5HXV2_CERBT|nr:hypothetical protein CB0940_05829 [Cercospora beticola]PIA97369.1 hypothetical protein CB0940_05829 [Cercospora beticola]
MAGKPAQQLGGGEGWEHLNAPAHWLRTALSAMAGGDDDTVRLKATKEACCRIAQRLRMVRFWGVLLFLCKSSESWRSYHFVAGVTPEASVTCTHRKPRESCRAAATSTRSSIEEHPPATSPTHITPRTRHNGRSPRKEVPRARRKADVAFLHCRLDHCIRHQLLCDRPCKHR